MELGKGGSFAQTGIFTAEETDLQIAVEASCFFPTAKPFSPSFSEKFGHDKLSSMRSAPAFSMILEVFSHLSSFDASR